jgi:ketosteroid isomerase-like protein
MRPHCAAASAVVGHILCEIEVALERRPLWKGKEWMANHEVHSAKVEGPWPHGDKFIVRFTYDVTNKPSGKRFNMDEAALFTVVGDKIVREEFFYAMG